MGYNINKENRKPGNKSGGNSQETFSGAAGEQGITGIEDERAALRKMAATILSEINEQFPTFEKLKALKKKIRYTTKEHSAAFRICKKYR